MREIERGCGGEGNRMIEIRIRDEDVWIDWDIEMIGAEMREYRDCMLESDKRYYE